ncbi:transcriptional regulator [Candidatus Micrarchaeota archaeon CG1_02_55_22]|nr:MAG: transcriptional regulator [Candidatus Micrarchaeota archaeon CG1_02_55_22]
MGFKQVVYWLIAGSRGGENRARIIAQINGKPSNARKLAQALKLDYKTVQHHLELLTKNGVLTSSGPNYGRVYFLSQESEEMYDEIKELSKEE